MSLRPLIESHGIPPDAIRATMAEIHATVLRESRTVTAGNFTRLSTADLGLLFRLYDQAFFAGAVRETLGPSPLSFALSRRLTSAAGKTVRREYPDGTTAYEIAASVTLLYETFRDDHRPVVMSGLTCTDRLEALQRIFEHELTHLVELLAYGTSSCSTDRFRSLALRFFGHTEHRHGLVTPAERAHTAGIRPGSRVAFRIDGQTKTGVVARVTRRATVLVEDARGEPYSDGRRYAKFYVPLEMLEAVG
jgi:hypothetical protein